MNDSSSFSEFRRLVASDIERFATYNLSVNPSGPKRLRVLFDVALFKAGFQAAFLYRLGHWFFQNRLIFLARCTMRLNLALCGADIGFAAEIGQGLLIGHPVGVVIAHKTRIGDNATIEAGVLFGVKSWAPGTVEQVPQTGDGCVFSTRCSVLGNCRLGDDVVVGINAVVVSDVESGALAAGLPLEIIPGRGRELTAAWRLYERPPTKAEPAGKR
jgi:serine O-acetyltransferase